MDLCVNKYLSTINQSLRLVSFFHSDATPHCGPSAHNVSVKVSICSPPSLIVWWIVLGGRRNLLEHKNQLFHFIHCFQCIICNGRVHALGPMLWRARHWNTKATIYCPTIQSIANVDLDRINYHPISSLTSLLSQAHLLCPCGLEDCSVDFIVVIIPDNLDVNCFWETFVCLCWFVLFFFFLVFFIDAKFVSILFKWHLWCCHWATQWLRDSRLFIYWFMVRSISVKRCEPSEHVYVVCGVRLIQSMAYLNVHLLHLRFVAWHPR